MTSTEPSKHSVTLTPHRLFSVSQLVNALQLLDETSETVNRIHICLVPVRTSPLEATIGLESQM